MGSFVQFRELGVFNMHQMWAHENFSISVLPNNGYRKPRFKILDSTSQPLGNRDVRKKFMNIFKLFFTQKQNLVQNTEKINKVLSDVNYGLDLRHPE